MAKLYAELTSDKGGRVASKGGDCRLNIAIALKNKTIGTILVTLGKDDAVGISFTDIEKDTRTLLLNNHRSTA